MVKVVAASPKPAKRRKSSVPFERVHDPATGGFVTLRTIDAASRTISSDLQEAFAKSVAKARRENKRVLGTYDAPLGKR